MKNSAPSSRGARRAARKGGKGGRPAEVDVHALIGLYRARRIDEAVAAAQRFTQHWPKAAVGWNVLAASQQAAGRLEAAAEAYRRAVKLEPENADAQNNLGLLLARLGRHEAAVKAHRRALAARPAFVEARYNLGLAQAALGRLDDAEASYREAIGQRPRFAAAHAQLGAVLQRQGRAEEAVAACRRALELDPGSLELRVQLGDLLRGAGLPGEAEAVLRRALEQEADHAQVHERLALALRDAGRVDEAERHFREALEREPNAPGVQRQLGNLLMDHGRLEEAEDAHRAALALEPDSPQAQRDHGVALAILGRPEEAEACFRQAIALQPDFSEAFYQLSAVKRFVPDDPDLAAIEALLARTDLPAEERERLHYAAGKAHADAGDDPATSMHHWSEAGRLARAAIDYDVSTDETRFAATEAAFPAERFAHGQAPQPADGPIFILGMPRSGTTLVEQILASHPDVHGAGERFDLERILDALQRGSGQAFGDWLAGLGSDDFAGIGRRYREAVLGAAPGAARVTDKMPDNFRFAGIVALAMPGARIVHVQRDPVDTCLSCFERRFAGRAYWSYDLAELGRYYRAYARLMEHWRRVLPTGVMLEVRYEDLVAEPEVASRALVAHCGLEWDPACLEFHQTRRAVVTASLAQVRRPLYRDSVARWRRYGAQLGPLLEALGPLAPQ